jgi:hypothetical protein
VTSLINRVTSALSGTEPPVVQTELPGPVMKNIERARARHAQWKPGWAETLAFIEGRHFVFRTKNGSTTTLNELDTSIARPEGYRSRTVRNRILDYWLSEVSSGTQRTPQYEVTPTNTDPEVMAAAKLAEKVLMYLYDFLELRPHLVEAYGYAVACGEGFIRPYWHAQLGDPLPPPEAPQQPADTNDQAAMAAYQAEMAGYDPNEQLYTGDICLESLGPDQVMWEPGAAFDESPYHIVERAQTIDYLKRLPNFTGVNLKPDTSGNQSFVQGQLNKSAAKGDMVMTSEYLELPSPDNLKGRRLLVANGQQIVPQEDYPLVVKGPKGYEPCLHRVSFIPTPWRDRDMGIIEHLLDAQRTVNDCVNKAIEHKNLLLVPQILVPRGSKTTRLTSEPGAEVMYDPVSGQVPKIRDMPAISDSLFTLKNDSVDDMEAIVSQRSVSASAQSAGGKAEATFIENEQRRSQMQIQALADFHSRLGRHLLLWVQDRYQEERLLSIVGRPGMSAAYVPFKGADLRDQTQVRVLPGSIEPLTRAAVEQKIMNYAQLGWISKEEGIAAIDNGTAENLVQDYELDVAKQNRENQQMDAIADENMPGGGLPDAAPYDNHQVHLDVLHRQMKSRDFEESAPPVQEAYTLHEQQHQAFIDQEAMKQAQQQGMQAEAMGMQNAARPAPPNGKPLPSLPSLNQQ